VIGPAAAQRRGGDDCEARQHRPAMGAEHARIR
jgi:hypothetical protein